MKKILMLSVILPLAGCDLPATPIVTDYNGDSVTIQTSAFANAEDAKVQAQAEADRICQRGHRKRAEYVSTRYDGNNYLNHNLYLCLK